MAGMTKIQHLDREIIYLDYRGQKEDQMIKYLREAQELILLGCAPKYWAASPTVSSCFSFASERRTMNLSLA